MLLQNIFHLVYIIMRVFNLCIRRPGLKLMVLSPYQIKTKSTLNTLIAKVPKESRMIVGASTQ